MMKDPFIDSQWRELCDHLSRVAEHLGGPLREADAFRLQDPPDRFSHLLDRVREATTLANKWRETQTSHRHDDDLIDEAGQESFPASDPPTFSHSHA
ncbi:hypothetical protein [Stieleria bergensis]